MKKSLYIASLFVFLITGCKKEKVEVAPQFGETPVFSVVGTIDGQSVSFQAGVESAFLTTYSTSVHGVNRFSGKLEKGDDYVDFGIFDGNIFSANSSIFQAGNVLALTQPYTNALFTLNKASCTNASLIDYLEIKINNIAVGESLVIYEPGIYSICVTVHYYDGAYKEVCNDLIIGYKDMAEFSIQYSLSAQGLLFASTETGLTKTQTKWYIDGTLNSSNADCNFNLAPGLHVLTAEVTFSNGATKSHSVIIDANLQGRYFEEFDSFKTELNDLLYQDFKAEFKVKLGGVLYEHVGNSSNEQVVLTGVSLYGKSATGNDVYKLSGIVSAEMKNTSTQEIVNAQFSVVIGLEIP